MNVPVPEYGPTPPVAVTVTVVVPPLHVMLPAVAVITNASGCGTVPTATEVADEHPFASVTV